MHPNILKVYHARGFIEIMNFDIVPIVYGG